MERLKLVLYVLMIGNLEIRNLNVLLMTGNVVSGLVTTVIQHINYTLTNVRELANVNTYARVFLQELIKHLVVKL